MRFIKKKCLLDILIFLLHHLLFNIYYYSLQKIENDLQIDIYLCNLFQKTTNIKEHI